MVCAGVGYRQRARDRMGSALSGAGPWWVCVLERDCTTGTSGVLRASEAEGVRGPPSPLAGGACLALGVYWGVSPERRALSCQARAPPLTHPSPAHHFLIFK